ncbi:unnamed protein product [Lepeophtheirus salmonis]|uniref:(salmon louse) hypothetical protein n=1 Tax=Lepeophtheirus salmonis TaxID=72036 RepID=A0A7R8H5X0_LEPSM|nr:unnamed protein product [Lepeophtheirus salmonis]CAF2871008.1 unnamed protein product [Lepeophtheirus salmonis]
MEKDGEDSSGKVSSNDGERNSQRKENDMSTCSATQMDEMNKSSAEKNNPAAVSEVEGVPSNMGWMERRNCQNETRSGSISKRTALDSELSPIKRTPQKFKKNQD